MHNQHRRLNPSNIIHMAWRITWYRSTAAVRNSSSSAQWTHMHMRRRRTIQAGGHGCCCTASVPFTPPPGQLGQAPSFPVTTQSHMRDQSILSVRHHLHLYMPRRQKEDANGRLVAAPPSPVLSFLVFAQSRLAAWAIISLNNRTSAAHVLVKDGEQNKKEIAGDEMRSWACVLYQEHMIPTRAFLCASSGQPIGCSAGAKV